MLALMGGASANASPVFPASCTARWLSLGVGLACLGGGTLAHAQATWVGDTSQDWNNAANWSSDPANPTGNFTVNTATAGVFPVVNAVSAFTPVDILVGDGVGTNGRLDVTAGSVATGNGNWLMVGRNGGTGTMNVTGGTVTTAQAHIGRTGGTIAGTATGTVNVSGSGILTTTDAIVLADGDSADDTSVGTLNVNAGGTVNCAASFVVAFAGNSNTIGTLNIATGGTVNIGSAGTRQLIMNEWDTTRGVINVNGGTLNLNADCNIRFSWGSWGPGSSNGPSSINLNSGAINMGSGAVLDLNYNADRAVTNTVTLNGGTLTTGSVISTKANGARVLNFNGGTLRAAAAAVTPATAFVGANAASAINVLSGGARIDSNGFDITVAPALLADSVSIGGGLTKLGAGTLTLNGASTYIGDTTVSAGGLTLADNASLKFLIAGTGVNNKITGTGTVTLNGDFTIDLAGAATALGSSWQLVDVNTLTETYGPTFTVATFTDNDGTWVKPANGTFYEFNPATGILRTIADPGISYDPPTVTPGEARDSYPIGSDFVLSVTASGIGNLSYQWYYQANAGATPVAIPGATGSSHTVTQATAGSGGIYSVIVSDDAATASGQQPTTATTVFPAISVLPGSNFSVAYYRFEEGPDAATITATNDSAGTNHLTVLGTPNYASDSLPYTIIPATGAANTLGANFPATGNNGLIAPTSGTLASAELKDFTVEAFVRLDSLAGWQTIVGRDDNGQVGGDAALFYLSKAGAKVGDGENNGFRVELTSRTGTNLQVNSTFIPVVGTWYHVAAVGDSAKGTLTLYVNGNSVGSSTGFTGLYLPTAGSDTPWTLGRGDYNNADVDFLRGDLDEVRISNAALPPSQFINSANGLAVVNPSVTISPTAQTAAINTPITLTATGTSNMGGSVTYQWYKGEDILTGQTSPTLAIDTSSVAGSGTYTVVVTDSNSTTAGFAITAEASSTIQLVTLPAPGRRTIGLNFVGAGSGDWSDQLATLATDYVAGFYPTTNWNNSATVTGVATQTTPLPLVESNGNSGVVTATWSSTGAWAARKETGAPETKTEHGRLIHGYIESRAETGATVTLSNIPYATYDVLVYVSGGNGGDRVGSVSLNREGSPTYYYRVQLNDLTRGPYSDDAPYVAIPTLGDSLSIEEARSAPPATFVHYTGVSGSELTITAKDATLNQNAGGIAAVQIVDTTPPGTAYPPSVTTAPVSRIVRGGADITFTVAGVSNNSGGVISYAWTKDGSPTVLGTGATLSLTNVTGGQSGNYSVTVTDSSPLGTSTTTRGASLVVVDATRQLLINGDINTASSPTLVGHGMLRADGTDTPADLGTGETVWNGILGAAGSATRNLAKESTGLALSGVTFSYVGADGAEDNTTLGVIAGTPAEALERDYLFANYSATPPATPFTATVGGLQALAGRKVVLYVYAVGKTTKTDNTTGTATVNDTAYVSLTTPNNHLNSPAGKTTVFGSNTEFDAGRNIELNNPETSLANWGPHVPGFTGSSAYVVHTGVVSAEGTVSWVLGSDTTAEGGGLVPLVGFQLLVTGEDIASAAPTGLTATAGNNQVTLGWNAASGATSYNVRRSTSSGTGYTIVATGVTATSYTDATATNGTTYYYVVTAAKSSPAAESGYSAEVSVTVGSAQTGLQSWRVTHFGSADNTGEGANTADPDGDGLPNLLEYALGTLPKVANSGSPVSVARSGNFLTLGFTPVVDASLTYAIEATNDLGGTWSTAHTYAAFGSTAPVTYTDTVALNSTARRFLRLKVTAAE